MLGIKMKAFFKYKEYRKHVLSEVKPLRVINIFIGSFLFFLLIVNGQTLKNYYDLNSKKVFSLTDFIKNNYANEVIINPSDQQVIEKADKDTPSAENNIINLENYIKIEEYNKALQRIKDLELENEKLNDDNINFQNLLKTTASQGKKPQNYRLSPQIVSRSGTLRGEYIGLFELTSYTPCKEECGNDLGITCSGYPIVPGVSVAVDTRYWPIGTVFYIKGLGYVVAMDSGSAIRGKEKLDFAVFDKSFARRIGRRKFEVYLIERGNGKIEDINF